MNNSVGMRSWHGSRNTCTLRSNVQI